MDDVMADADAHGDAEGVARCVDLSLRLRETTVARVDHVTSAVAARPDEFSNGGGDDYGSDASATGIKVSIWANVVPKSFRGAAKAVALKGAGMQVDIPKPINVLKVAMRACHYSFDAHTPTAAAPSDWVVLGGVVTVDFFFLAPPPKTIRAQWTMRQSTVDAVAGLQRMPYGDEHGAAAILAPIKVRYGLPACVHAVPADGERAMLHWDKAAMAWSLEGVEQGSHDLVFHAEAREVQFTTNKSGAFALAQSRVLDMPYASWSMAPALEVQALDSDIDVDKDEEGCVHLSVTTARGRTVLIQVCPRSASLRLCFLGKGPAQHSLCALISVCVLAQRLQVTADCCQLLEPEIAGLHLRKLGPGQLLRALAAAGINLLPTDADAARIGKRIVKRAEAAGGSPDGVVADSVVPKSPELEAAAYASMAALASSFDFESSRWNPKVGRGRAVVQARETSVYTGGNAETLDLKLVLIEEDKHSESYRHCPDVGDIPAPAIKSSLIVQSEALPPPVEEVKAAEPDGVKEAKVEAAAEAEAEAAEPLAEERPKGEVFNETRVAGTKTHVALRTTLQGSSSEEALERVDRASLILCRTLAQVLKLTRPLSFG